MTLAATNGAAAGNGGASASITTPSKTTSGSGSGFIAAFIFDRARTLTVSDSKSNSYTLANAEVDDASGGFITRLYYCPNGTGGGSHTVQGTLDTTGVVSVFFCEITTTNGAGLVLDQANQNSDVASPFASPAVTTLVANEILVSFFGGNSGSNPATHNASANSFTIVSGADLTNGSTDWTGALASRVVSSTGSYSGSWTETGGTRTGVHIATFSEAAGGGGGRILRPSDGMSGGMRSMSGGMSGRAHIPCSARRTICRPQSRFAAPIHFNKSPATLAQRYS